MFGSGQVTSEKWVRKGFSEEGRVSRVSREKKEVTLSRPESRDARAEGTARAGVLPGERGCQSAPRHTGARWEERGPRYSKPARSCGTPRASAERGGLIPRPWRATGRHFADGGLGWFLLQGHYSGVGGGRVTMTGVRKGCRKTSQEAPAQRDAHGWDEVGRDGEEDAGDVGWDWRWKHRMGQHAWLL